MEERGAREWDGLGEEGLEGGGMSMMCGIREKEGGGDGDAGGQVTMDDAEGVGLLGGGKRLRGGAERENIGSGRPW